MRHRTACALAGAAATLVLAIAAGTAFAANLSVSSQLFRIVWANLTFSGSSGGFPITCPVTLEGSFHSRTIAKRANSFVAHITSATVDDPNCASGHATILRETLPWRVNYQSFSGTLPDIELLMHTLIGAGFSLEPGLDVVCLAQTSTEFPASGNANRSITGSITTLEADPDPSIPVTGDLDCPLFGKFSGTGQVTVQGTRDSVRMTLI
jgi:hypothetical protein